MDSLLAILYRSPASIRDLLSDDASVHFNVPLRIETREQKGKSLAIGLARDWLRPQTLQSHGPGKAELIGLVETGRIFDHPSANLRVGLTSKGGALWESKAKPEWDFFLEEANPRVAKDYVWIRFEGRSRVWLSCVDQTLKRLGFFLGSKSRVVARRGWRPIYWKRFNAGYALEINTGARADEQEGKNYIDGGLTIANDRLATVISVLSAIWDAKWIARLQNRKHPMQKT